MNTWSRPLGTYILHSPSGGLTLRPLAGGYLGDLIYRRYGVTGKKYLTLALGALAGFMSLGLGLYIDRGEKPSRG